MGIGMTNPSRCHTHKNFARLGLRDFNIGRYERLSNFDETNGLHKKDSLRSLGRIAAHQGGNLGNFLFEFADLLL